MFVLFFLIWVIFNGQLTVEIAAFGVVIAGVMYWFLCKFFDYSPRCDLFFMQKSAAPAAVYTDSGMGNHKGKPHRFSFNLHCRV